MRVLHINVTNGKGSTGGIIKNINDYLKNTYNDCDTFVAFSVGEKVPNSFKFINPVEDFFVRAGRKLFGKSLFGLYFPTRRLIKFIEKVKPDIIHLHTIHHQTLDYKMLFKYLKTFSGQVVYTLHDCWPFTGGCYYYSDAGCQAFLSGCCACTQPEEALDCRPGNAEKEYLIKKEALHSIPRLTFIAVSDWLASEAKRSHLADKEIITVHNGINADVFKLLETKKNDVFTVISVAAHWSERKHLNYLLELSKELKDIKFVVVGGGVDNIDKDSYPNVEFIRRTDSRQELCELYNKAHLFANFSTEETFGLVTAEAMACGLPVVTFNKTACGEIVDAECGYTVDTLDEFKEALLKLKNEGTSEYSEVCRNKVLENYTCDIMAKKYAKVYCDLLNK